AAGRGDGREEEADLVAHTACRVLVDHRPIQREVAPVEHGSRSGHGGREPSGLLEGHGIEENGHRQRGDLLRRQAAVGKAVDEQLDFLPRQFVAVALFSDYFGEEHLCPRSRDRWLIMQESAGGGELLRRRLSNAGWSISQLPVRSSTLPLWH